MCMPGAQSSQRKVLNSLESELEKVSEPPCGHWESNHVLCKEQPVPLATEPFLQPLRVSCGSVLDFVHLPVLLPPAVVGQGTVGLRHLMHIVLPLDHGTPVMKSLQQLI